MRFDFYCGTAKLSLPTRRQNGLAAYAALRWSAGVTLGHDNIPRELLEELFFVALGPPEYAEPVSREIRTPGHKGPPDLPRHLAEVPSLDDGHQQLIEWCAEMQGLEPPTLALPGPPAPIGDSALVALHSKLTGDTRTQFLLRKLAGSSPVVACIPRHPGGRETVSLAYEENIFKEGEFFGREYVASSGWAPFPLNIATPYAGASSYHFEFLAPEGLEVLHAQLIPIVERENEEKPYRLTDNLEPDKRSDGEDSAGVGGEPSATSDTTANDETADEDAAASDETAHGDSQASDNTSQEDAPPRADTEGEHAPAADATAEEQTAPAERSDLAPTVPGPEGASGIEGPRGAGGGQEGAVEKALGEESGDSSEGQAAKTGHEAWEDETGRPDFSFKPERGLRVHLYEPAASKIDSLTVHVSLRARREAFVGPAFWAGLSVFFILAFCCALAEPLVSHANGAQSLLLVFPGLLIALLARAGDHGLVKRIVRRPRWALVRCGVLAFLGASLLALIRTGDGAHAETWVRFYYGGLAAYAGIQTLRLFLARLLPRRVAGPDQRSAEEKVVDRAADLIQARALLLARFRQRHLELRAYVPSWEVANALLETNGPKGGYAFEAGDREGECEPHIRLRRRRPKIPMLATNATPFDGFFRQTVARARESAATVKFIDDRVAGDWSLYIGWRPSWLRFAASGVKNGYSRSGWRVKWSRPSGLFSQEEVNRDVSWATAAARRQSLRLRHTYRIVQPATSESHTFDAEES